MRARSSSAISTRKPLPTLFHPRLPGTDLRRYLDDCYLQNVSPSLPQLLLFLDSAEVSLAFPFGPNWLMRALSYSMGVVVGRWFGGYVLGYKASYPEYWSDRQETKKAR